MPRRCRACAAPSRWPILFEGEDNLLIGARQGAPLAVGYGDGEMYLGSDALALAPFTDRIAYLEEGDWVVADARGRGVPRPSTARSSRAASSGARPAACSIEKGNYRHFMAKEIHEQPEVVGHTLAHYVDMRRAARASVRLAGRSGEAVAHHHRRLRHRLYGRPHRQILDRALSRACRSRSTSRREYRYREAPVDTGGVTIVISQSGETADTLASLRYAKEQRPARSSASSTCRPRASRALADAVAPTLAGPEIGVASTKAFTCQLVGARLRWRSALGRARGTLDEARRGGAGRANLTAVPGLMARGAEARAGGREDRATLAQARDVLYLGRGTSYPLALEGALKLKEISYIHAEGYAAGELKHGPIALIDEAMPVIVIAPRDAVFEKTVSNMQEVAARGGRIILIGDTTAAAEAAVGLEHFLAMPDMGDRLRADRLCRAGPDDRLSHRGDHG